MEKCVEIERSIIKKYRKEIKAYGKYVIGKLTKRGDE